MINRVVLVGRLTRDPELRKTTSGMSVASFTVAIDNPTSKDNQERTTSFIPCTAWGQRADYITKYAFKGSLVAVDGRLNQRSYDSKDGRKVQVIEVVCDNVNSLERRNGAANSVVEPDQDLGYQPDPIPSEDESKKNVTSIDVADDDLPF
jgi:single-strand DNA-binding protein